MRIWLVKHQAYTQFDKGPGGLWTVMKGDKHEANHPSIAWEQHRQIDWKSLREVA